MPRLGVSRLAMSTIEIECLRPVGVGRAAASAVGRRHLVGDERIVGQDRRRKETVAGKAVSDSGRRDGQGKRADGGKQPPPVMNGMASTEPSGASQERASGRNEAADQVRRQAVEGGASGAGGRRGAIGGAGCRGAEMNDRELASADDRGRWRRAAAPAPAEPGRMPNRQHDVGVVLVRRLGIVCRRAPRRATPGEAQRVLAEQGREIGVRQVRQPAGAPMPARPSAGRAPARRARCRPDAGDIGCGERIIATRILNRVARHSRA